MRAGLANESARKVYEIGCSVRRSVAHCVAQAQSANSFVERCAKQIPQHIGWRARCVLRDVRHRESLAKGKTDRVRAAPANALDGPIFDKTSNW